MPEAVDRVPLPLPMPSAESGLLPALALALLLPMLLAVAAWLPTLAQSMLDTDNRAFVWIDGDAVAQQAARRAVAADPTFAGGSAQVPLGHLPHGCRVGATRLHFDVRRIDQAQPTRAALEQLARDAGAHVCAANVFELNVPVHADHEPLRWLRNEAWQALVLLVLPAALVALAFAAPFAAPARRRLRADAPPAWQRPLLLAAGVALLAATTLALATAGVFAPLQRAAISGLSPAFALHELVLLPFLHQLVFRTWFFAQMPARLPPPMVAVLSTAASVAAAWPSSLADLAVATLLAGSCTALYLRTRSLLPAVALHAAVVALQDAAMIAG